MSEKGREREEEEEEEEEERETTIAQVAIDLLLAFRRALRTAHHDPGRKGEEAVPQGTVSFRAGPRKLC